MGEHPIPESERTTLADAAEAGSAQLPALIEKHHQSLIAIAARVFAGESPAHSLTPEGLLAEAFLRLVDQRRVTAKGTVFFYGCFASECHRILIAHARRRRAGRRGGALRRHTIATDHAGLGDSGGMDLFLLSEAIESYRRRSERGARIVEMRVFTRLTVEQCAAVLGISPRQVDKDWALAKAWLRRELAR